MDKLRIFIFVLWPSNGVGDSLTSGENTWPAGSTGEMEGGWVTVSVGILGGGGTEMGQKELNYGQTMKW